MTPAATPEALVDGDHDMPTEAEIEAMREEAENFRLPAPPPTPVRGRFYLTECEHCGWVGSSEHCGNGGYPDYDDVICPVCCSSMLGDGPNEADTAKHGEAVYQRIVSAEAARDAALADRQRVTTERDAAITACAEMIRLAEMGYEEAMAEPEERGSYAAFHRAKAACEAAPGVAETAKTLAGQYATATAEAASLRAEAEAKDKRIAELEAALEPFARFGEVATPDTAITWSGVRHTERISTRFRHEHFRAARTALARAATAGEGRSDG